jgi:DNA-binding Lrp family transcriptional regulator
MVPKLGVRGARNKSLKRPGLSGHLPPRRDRMTPFFVLIKAQLGRAYEVANALADAEIASEIYSTAGDYDLLVKFYVDRDTDIGHFVNEKVHAVPGILDTKTIITFKAF